MTEAIGIIPARLESTRLPRKLLLNETGKPLLQHTWEAATNAGRLSRVIVATDSDQIEAACHEFGAEVCRTGACANGTERIAEAVRTLGITADVVVNIQGDEPEIEPELIDRVVDALEQNSDCEMATLANPIFDSAHVLDPSCVKVVCDARGRALYFSRAPIPYSRDRTIEEHFGTSAPGYTPPWLQHIGLYAYRTPFLEAFVQMPPARLEQMEQLEQLRALQAGAKIKVISVSVASQGIDTSADYAAFVERRRLSSSS